MHFPTALLPLAALIPSAFAADQGVLSVLTFNIAGLPAFLENNGVPGDKTTNTKTIGTKLTQYAYDVVHVQEDFNYHAALYSTANYPYRTATSGGVPFGSGLNTLSQHPWTVFNRIKWAKCFINEADCLTPKGFTMMRMTIDDGVEIDFYNLHADAGSDLSGDANARLVDVGQMISYIDGNSAGRPVVLFGDTNDLYTNSYVSISHLTSQVGLQDAWVQFIRGGSTPMPGSPSNECANPANSTTCESLDKIFYRGGSIPDGATINIAAVDFEYATSKFLQADGSILSDHNPVNVKLQWTRV
ncbi:hypothetical protein K461DRAFT_235828 [Myriangium duriaei CBS 260.36]|uniref:Inositol polyphosphate-related phosphatase domain-containing protein n=1 Tax=Myriangium duriaei CBS 260.36 TaxID=1168546 RepID=A0A9P4J9U7_9PEZI|nr:hypothetical protein K461DRAFT_235828 [Myriangium duriaei CBS 260.36]